MKRSIPWGKVHHNDGGGTMPLTACRFPELEKALREIGFKWVKGQTSYYGNTNNFYDLWSHSAGGETRWQSKISVVYGCDHGDTIKNKIKAFQEAADGLTLRNLP